MTWDAVIPWEPLWKQLRRVMADNGTALAFGCQPFTTDLIMSARDIFRYDLVWQKNRTTGFLHAKNKVLKAHEDIIVFSKGTTVHAHQSGNRMCYNPQGLRSIGTTHYKAKRETVRYMQISGTNERANLPYEGFTGYPKSILSFSKDESHYHPTQKPVALLEYLIRTFSNEGDTILDPTMGSGSAGVAAVNCGRSFVGYEADATYYEIARERIVPQN